MNAGTRQIVARALLATALLGAPAIGPARADEQRSSESASDLGLRASLRKVAETGDYVEVLRATDRALAETPTSVPALEYRALALQRLGHCDAACAAYRTLLAARPEHAWALTQLGHLCGTTGQFDDAERLLRRAIQLDPSSSDTRRKLIGVQRSRRDYVGAVSTVAEALGAGDDAVWCYAQIAYLHWARHDPDGAHAALGCANAAGAPSDDVDRVERLLRWENEARGDREPVSGSRGAPGREWRFPMKGVLVVSELGPRMPAELAKLVTEVPARHRAWLGATEQATPIVIRLHRTLEDHEDVRRLRFPQGSPGRAFLDRGNEGPGRSARRAEFTIHVAATADALPTSISHELAHAAIYDVTPWAPPPWLDEGLATYLETPPGGGEARGARPELEAIVRTSLAAGRALPWRRLFAADRREFDGADARARYAQAWSVVRFLVERALAPKPSDPAGESAIETVRRKRLAALLQAASTILINDETLRAIGTTAGADLGRLERVWADSAK